MRQRGRRWSAYVIAVVLSALSIGPRAAEAQEPATVAVSDTVWEIRLADGSTIIGQVTASTPERITVRTLAGATVDIGRSSIRSISASNGTVRDGRFWPVDPNRTRLFFGPTGRMLDRGEGYISVFELFLPFLSYGVTDQVTIAGGTPILPEAIGRVWYLAPKVGARIGERTTLAGGVFGFFDADTDIFDDLDAVGVLYGVGTYGTDHDAFTFGAGWGFAGDEIANRPVFLVGGESRLSPRITALTENYLFLYDDSDGIDESTALGSLLSIGVRFIGDRLSADAGLGLVMDADGIFCCLPLVNFVYNFGGSR